MDGNKRTGIICIIALLKEFNIIFTASQEDVYNFTIRISTGEIKFEEIVEWLKSNTKTV